VPPPVEETPVTITVGDVPAAVTVLFVNQTWLLVALKLEPVMVTLVPATFTAVMRGLAADFAP
jgi:hypothetical protein